MFKSKLFQYCAIAATVVVTSGVIVSSNASLQSQSTKSQAQSQIATQPQSTTPNNLSKQPDSMKRIAERPNGSDMPSGKILKQLNLTPDQLQKLKAIRDRDLDRIRELTQQSRQANKELRDLLASTESNDVIRAKHTQALNLQQELQKQHFERMLSMREILTPQQRSQLNEIMQKNRLTRMKDRTKQRIDKPSDHTL